MVSNYKGSEAFMKCVSGFTKLWKLLIYIFFNLSKFYLANENTSKQHKISLIDSVCQKRLISCFL